MKTILVVDNDPQQCELYAAQLADASHRVVCAHDGHEAIMRSHECHPDVVVLEVHLPRMDGLELMSRLIEEQPKLPIIINTAYNYRDSFMSWAADAYVIKSHDLSELKERIYETLQEPTLPMVA